MGAMWTATVLLAASAAGVSGKKSEVAVAGQQGYCAANRWEPANWGHLYVDGGVESLEFFTSQ